MAACRTNIGWGLFMILGREMRFNGQSGKGNNVGFSVAKGYAIERFPPFNRGQWQGISVLLIRVNLLYCIIAVNAARPFARGRAAKIR